MQIQTKFLDDILPENDKVYYSYLVGVIESVDELSSLEIIQSLHGLSIRIAPSLPKYTDTLLEELLKLHNLFNIHLDLSKSIKSSGGTISFEISTK